MTFRHWLQVLPDRLRTVGRIFRHFESPWLVVAMRIGWMRQELFHYRIRHARGVWALLARPAANFHSDLAVLDEVMVREAYRDALDHLPQRPLRGLDVGANIGAFTLWLGSHRSLREVHCFEPSPDSYRLLCFNVAEAGLAGIHLHERAVAGMDRMARLHRPAGRPGAAGLYGAASPDAASRDLVEVVSLARWLAGHEGEIDFLKLDCEGAEWEILRETAPALLARIRFLIGELHVDPDGIDEPTAFPGLLERAGFEVLKCECHHLGLFLARGRA